MKNLYAVLFVLGLAALPQVAQAQCPGDTNNDGVVNVQDLVEVITQWGPCSGTCTGDIISDGVVNVQDLVAVITNWGVCPDLCVDLAGVEFMGGVGAPMPLGAAVIDGSCSMIFGNLIPAGVVLFANVSECQATCDGCTTNDECLADEYCFFEDYTCGDEGFGTCEPRGEVCAAIYDPVCTCAYQIASSACHATIIGQSVMADGECAQEDVCNHNGGTWDPALPEGEQCICPAGTEYNYQRGCEVL